jgi:hypothetical protein
MLILGSFLSMLAFRLGGGGVAASFPPWMRRLGGSWSLRYACCSWCRPLLRAWASRALCTPFGGTSWSTPRPVWFGPVVRSPNLRRLWAVRWLVQYWSWSRSLAWVVTLPISSVYPLTILGGSRCKASIVAWLMWVVLLSVWRRVCIVEPFGVVSTVLASSSIKLIHLPGCILEYFVVCYTFHVR